MRSGTSYCHSFDALVRGRRCIPMDRNRTSPSNGSAGAEANLARTRGGAAQVQLSDLWPLANLTAIAGAHLAFSSTIISLPSRTQCTTSSHTSNNVKRELENSAVLRPTSATGRIRSSQPLSTRFPSKANLSVVDASRGLLPKPSELGICKQSLSLWRLSISTSQLLTAFFSTSRTRLSLLALRQACLVVLPISPTAST